MKPPYLMSFLANSDWHCSPVPGLNEAASIKTKTIAEFHKVINQPGMSAGSTVWIDL
jgi:hypothetical protein